MNGEESQNLEVFEKHAKRLRYIHLALVAGMLFLAVLAYYLQQSPLAELQSGHDTYIYLVPIVALAGYFGGIYTFRKLLSTLAPEVGLTIRLSRFQTASLLQYACLEVPSLLALFAYIQQGYLLYAAIAAFLILYLISQHPSRKRILRNIPLSREEQEHLMEVTFQQ